MSKTPSFQFYPGDFLVGTADMTYEERGAYITLLCFAWEARGLPTDEGRIARVMGGTPDEFERVWPTVKTKWYEADGRLYNARQEEVRAELAAFYERAKKGGVARVAGAERLANGRLAPAKPPAKRPAKNQPPSSLDVGDKHQLEHQPTSRSSTSTSTSVEETQGFFYVSVVHLCDLLADSIKDNGLKRPSVTEKWRQEAERMLRIDGRDPDEAAQLIRWAQAHEFWRSNVLSMPKFRQKYDQLLLQSKRGENTERRHPADIQVAKLDALAERFAAEEAVA